MNEFINLGVAEDLVQAISELGFEKPTPVQQEVIPYILQEKRDLIALAQTGTGKTAAFGLPVIQQINAGSKHPQVLILSPTRELCVQIAADMRDFTRFRQEVKTVAVYGGVSIDKQIELIEKGVSVVVATPGRMLDIIRRGIIDLSEIKYVIFDEADEMLDMGFRDELTGILETTPDTKHVLLFSATMPQEVEHISKEFMKTPHRIVVGKRNTGSENVSHQYFVVRTSDRYTAMRRVIDFYPGMYALVFCRTRRETQEIADLLIKDGYNADSLHGDLSQLQRDNVMKRFRLKNIQILVATDVAARGLDVDNLSHVLNYNLPDDPSAYTHRSGRTGRADKMGISVSFVTDREKKRIQYLEKSINRPFELIKIPTGSDICEKQLFHMIDKMIHLDINDSEIDNYLPQINKKLAQFDRDELIKRFVAVEFNWFLDVYRNAPDLNEKVKASHNSYEDDRNFTRLFINLGYLDNIKPQSLMGLMNDHLHTKRMKVGRIEITRTCSFFEVETDIADDLIIALNKVIYNERKVFVEIASKRKGNVRERGYKLDKDDDGSEPKRERSYRSDKGDRKDRGDRSDRSSRGGFKSDRSSFGGEKREKNSSSSTAYPKKRSESKSFAPPKQRGESKGERKSGGDRNRKPGRW